MMGGGVWMIARMLPNAGNPHLSYWKPNRWLPHQNFAVTKQASYQGKGSLDHSQIQTNGVNGVNGVKGVRMVSMDAALERPKPSAVWGQRVIIAYHIDLRPRG
jgi:hypothetical protein